jgi:hypothetical protein
MSANPPPLDSGILAICVFSFLLVLSLFQLSGAPGGLLFFPALKSLDLRPQVQNFFPHRHVVVGANKGAPLPPVALPEDRRLQGRMRVPLRL